MSDNKGRYIYHYNAITLGGRQSLSGVAQITKRVVSIEDYEDFKEQIRKQCDFDCVSLTSLSYLGREFE